MSNEQELPSVVVLFGGLSAEAEISVVSGTAIATALMDRGVEVTQLLITRGGLAALLPPGHRRGEQSPGAYTDQSRVRSIVGSDLRPLKAVLADVLRDQPNAVYVPALHGPGDESGFVQEALSTAGVAYVGAAPVAARLGMDKDAFKRLAGSLGVPVLPHIVISASDWANDREGAMQRFEAFVASNSESGALIGKPVAHGSSIGMSIARHRDEWASAVDLALEFGEAALLEPYLEHPRELEVAVLEAPDGSVTAHGPGEVFPGREFYDYDAKYVSGVSRTTVSPAVSNETRKKLQETSVELFRAFGGRGLARMDFLMRAAPGESGQWYISEVNTFPGFTPISLFPALLAADGIGFADLALHLVRTAVAQQRAGR